MATSDAACPECGADFDTEESLQDHFMTIHLVDKTDDAIHGDAGHDGRSSPETGRIVLVTGSRLGTGQTDGWGAVVGAIPAESSVLVLTNRDSPDEWLARWRRHTGTIPSALQFIAIGKPAQSAVSPQRHTTVEREVCDVQMVSNCADLTAIGIAFADSMSPHESDDSTAVVVVDSLTVLLHCARTRRVFRFLEMLTDAVRTCGCTAYVHVNPDAHDERTLEVLEDVFDGAIALGNM